MTTLTTMPGRHGDILWALPTVRAISEVYPPVDLLIADKYRAVAELIEARAPYVQAVIPDKSWAVVEAAPIMPSTPHGPLAAGYERVIHLGYRDWPELPLPYQVCRNAHGHGDSEHFSLDPWLRADPGPEDLALLAHTTDVAVGFSEEWAELKVGVLLAVADAFPDKLFTLLTPAPSRYFEWSQALGRRNLVLLPCGFLEAARTIQAAKVFLGCLSALWVVANAVGTPAVIVEPEEKRHHPIFWVDRGGENVMVYGVDGKPSFDARHTVDAVRRALEPKEVKT